MRKPMPLKQALLWMARKWDKPWQVGRRAYLEPMELHFFGIRGICHQALHMWLCGLIDFQTKELIVEKATPPRRAFRFPRTLAGARQRAAWLRKWAAKL